MLRNKLTGCATLLDTPKHIQSPNVFMLYRQFWPFRYNFCTNLLLRTDLLNPSRRGRKVTRSVHFFTLPPSKLYLIKSKPDRHPENLSCSATIILTVHLTECDRYWPHRMETNSKRFKITWHILARKTN